MERLGLTKQDFLSLTFTGFLERVELQLEKEKNQAFPFAALASVIGRMFGGTNSPEDFLPHFIRPVPQVPDSEEYINEQYFKLIKMAKANNGR